MSFWRALDEAVAAGELVTLCTVIGVDGSAPRHAGARMLVWPDGRILGTVGGGTFEHRVIAAAQEAMRDGLPRRFTVHLTRDLGMCCGGAMDVYLEPLAPTERLYIFGAGHVARPTARLAAELGFAVTVIDEREEFATAERFPDATLHVGDPRRFARALPVDARTWVLLVTHEHQLDQDLLELLLPSPLAWLGLIGSRNKLARFFLRLKAAGVDEALFAKVSGPVGLDLGAETPEEIAVSIAAELVRTRRGVTRPPLPLSELPLPARGGDGTARPPRLRGSTRWASCSSRTACSRSRSTTGTSPRRTRSG
jgi:xanthine dehydrogenase accessory factor